MLIQAIDEPIKSLDLRLINEKYENSETKVNFLEFRCFL